MLEWEQEKFIIYLAGFVDGEGCLNLKSSKRQRSAARFTLSNTNHGVLLFIQFKLEQLDITVSLNEIRRNTPGNRQRCWCIEAAQNSVGKLCKLLFPYLIVKSQQAELLSRFVFLRELEGSTGNTFEDEESEIYLKLKTLNRVGVS